MIVNWTKDGMKVIPAHIPTADEPSANTRFAVLAPGFNDIPDELWVEARTFVQKELAEGTLTEEWVKVQKPEHDEKMPLIWLESEDKRENKTMRTAATIRDINRPMVIDRVIKKTFHPGTLQKWSGEEVRPDVQAALQKQIDAVERGAIVD